MDLNEWGLVNEDKAKAFVMELYDLEEKYSLRIYPGFELTWDYEGYCGVPYICGTESYIYLEDDDGNSIIMDNVDLD